MKFLEESDGNFQFYETILIKRSVVKNEVSKYCFASEENAKRNDVNDAN